MSEWFSDEAFRKQAALDARLGGRMLGWSDLLEVGGEEHGGVRWCSVCVGRGHHEDQP